MEQVRRRAAALMLAIATGSSSQAGGEPLDATSVTLEGSHLMVTLADGSTVSGDRLIGMEVPLAADQPDGWTLRFDDLLPDAHARSPGALLYDVSVRESGDGPWHKLCAPDPFGATTAIAVPGRFEAGPAGSFVPGAPGSFTFACTAEANGKCIRFGYPPWSKTLGGIDLAPYHAACVRMIRADYCGDGSSHTEPDTLVQMFDTAGVNRPRGVLYGSFEAIWSEAGALCVAKPRHPDYPLESILAACPKLAESAGEGCTEESLRTLPGALLANRS